MEGGPCNHLLKRADIWVVVDGQLARYAGLRVVVRHMSSQNVSSSGREVKRKVGRVFDYCTYLCRR